MQTIMINQITADTHYSPSQIKSVIDLLDQDASIPFIARYRKEMTGSLDEVNITDIRDRVVKHRELAARKSAVLKSLEKNGHLTDTLKTRVDQTESLTALEDLYLPYKPKRKTKGSVAREKGLEPLAQTIFQQTPINITSEANQFLSDKHSISTPEQALDGARDIIAEMINEDKDARAILRKLYYNKGYYHSTVIKGMETTGQKFQDYFDWSEPVKKTPSHRVLAMRRGEKEKVLSLSVKPPEEEAIQQLEALFVKGDNAASNQVRLALQDSYKRLLSRAMETETRLLAKQEADTHAIRIFAENLRQLLLAPPLGAKNILGIDPGFRTGCKLVCIDKQGKLVHHETIFPNFQSNGPAKAVNSVVACCKQYHIQAIAIGNGTAGRETEAFIKSMGLDSNIIIMQVNESGASIYSASETAREEFPDLDLTYRGAVSIARRLMDPLAELVKIAPQSIGVGQYQHDVDQSLLQTALDDVVISCVNGVGVDLNTASPQILTYVSGLGEGLAKKIITYRDTNGAFPNREALKKVPRLGPKAFEQAAGFLRINNGDTPLDQSAVHPESYHIVEKMASDIGCSVIDLLNQKELRDKINIHNYIDETIGIPTLRDIIEEIGKPGRDPRDCFQAFSFASGIDRIDDLYPGLKLPGIVTNITAFGVFVDIGVHQDGLIHISELSDRFVKDPATIVQVNQQISVRVVTVDKDRKRIALSLKKEPGNAPKPTGKKPLQKKSAPQPSPFNNPFEKLLGK